MIIDGEICDLLVITLRGTNNKWEAIKDGTCVADKEFYEYVAWDWVYEFEEDVFGGLEHYHIHHPTLGTRKLKILVTGHSLGGAGTNLVAAKLNKEADSRNWFSQNTTIDDIYAYTFGAIDSISKEKTDSSAHLSGGGIDVPVVSGYANILNIYNYLDTFGPYGRGVWSIGHFRVTAAGNKMYEKFGLFYTFTDDMRHVTNPDSLWATHEIAGYVQALKEGWLASDVKTERTRVWIRCPVDIDVYKADQLVCKIVSDELFLQTEEIPVSIENGAKTLLLPKDQDYRIVITATDAGTMEYSVLDLDDTGSRPVEYRNIPLESGKKMVSEILAGSDPGTAELYVLDQKGNKAAKIMGDGSEIKMNNRSALWIIIPGFIFGSLCVAVPAVIIRRKKRRLLAAGVQNEDAQMYCTYCGHLIESGEYCAYCGRKAE